MPQTAQPTSTVTSDPSPIGARRMWVGAITIGDNYSTGGVAVPAALFGLTVVDYIESSVNSSGARTSRWNPALGTYQIFTGGAELGAASAAAVGDVYPCVVFGI